MKPNMHWQYRPYAPLNKLYIAQNPYVCRLAPHEHSFDLELLDNGAPEARHVLKLRLRGTEDEWRCVPMEGDLLTVDGLESDQEYEFFVCRDGDEEHCSALRLVRTGFYPDLMVNYCHPEDDHYISSGRYLCDPSIVRAPSGALVISMDIFAPNMPQNMSVLYRSEDNGKTWRYLCDLVPCFFETLFVHNGVLYMLATSTENGNLLIGASYDEGYTWTRPVMLFPGSILQLGNGFQRQPMPVIVHNGRIMTNIEYGCWTAPTRFGIGTLSAPEDADLLDPASWTVSDFTYYDKNWPGSPVGGVITFLEGSIYEATDGKLINLLRMQITESVPNHGKACLLELDPDDLEKAPAFHSIIDMPTGANSRTHILKDPVGGKYWGIGNLHTDPDTPWRRNVMALVVSDDGYDWRVAKLLLDYRDTDPQKVGFQYTSFIFDGDDILYLCRTSFNGANSFHDANCQTFGVVKNFRELG